MWLSCVGSVTMVTRCGTLFALWLDVQKICAVRDKWLFLGFSVYPIFEINYLEMFQEIYFSHMNMEGICSIFSVFNSILVVKQPSLSLQMNLLNI